MQSYSPVDVDAGVDLNVDVDVDVDVDTRKYTRGNSSVLVGLATRC